ncbi:MAG TPA: methyltransferase domain-containing protein [Dehalococcoidia bacterium]|nr:methyltransferase domain-containing protein [Dehalococcoidia bacterium]
MGRREKPVAAEGPAGGVGAILRRARHDKGLSLSGLAQTLRYTKGHLSAVETGAVAPSRELLRAYEEVLGLPAGELIDAAERLGSAGARRPQRGLTPPAEAAPPPSAGIEEALRQVYALIGDAGSGGEEITLTLQIRKSSGAAPADHKDLVRQEVTRQAAAYAANPSIADPERVARLIDAVDPSPDARVLDVAAGPGYVALGFAAVCKEVVGLDLTAAPLAIAESMRRERHLTNLRFECGDVEDLPFADDEFDAVVCHFTFHHLEDPGLALAEMARVCRTGGVVAVEDLVTSEWPERAAYQNRIERLRDPSHVRAMPISELIGLFTAQGLEVQTVQTGRLSPTVERWLADAQTPPERAAEVRALIERDAAEDLSGTRPIRWGGELTIVQRTALIAGRKL